MNERERLFLKELEVFGVPCDPTGDRYRWGTPETDEAVVSMIERQYPAAEHQGWIVFYGPSNITLWLSLERDMLPYRAQNHGMGGCVDEDLMRYAPRLLYPYHPQAVFFQTGSNDLVSGIPLETILENKKKMYRMFLDHMPDSELIVCSGLPLPGRTAYWPATERTNRLLEDMCRSMDRMHFLDATPAMLSDAGEEALSAGGGRFFRPEYFLCDRIHLNRAGHDVWTALMKRTLAEIL